MSDSFTYQKKREEFGRYPLFEDTEVRQLGFVRPKPKDKEDYILRNPDKHVLDNIPVYSQHSVNTQRVATNNVGMKHMQGGWPDNTDPDEPSEVAKYKKRLDRDQTYGFAPAVTATSNEAKNCILQNNQNDLFEEYFDGEVPEHQTETISTKTVMLLKDPNTVKRSVSRITWHPDSNQDARVSVCYSILRFQQMSAKMPYESYIWNLNNPNLPEKTLSPPSPLCTSAFNHKNFEILAAGSYNGSLSFFDLRIGNSAGVIRPEKTTVLEKSHHDPVYDIYWLTHGKTNTECVSTSTDGRILWWDTRNLEAPTEEFVIEQDADGNGSKVLGGTRLEYCVDASPLKYLVGTEQGYIFQANKRPGRPVEINQKFGVSGGKHHGPIYSIQRNPSIVKYFLTVGDWTAKIWSDELSTPLMQTKYHNSYLTDGCWSPQRKGLFFLTRMDGFIDIWDYLYRQNEVAYSYKISDNPLTSIAISPGEGKMAAIGDSEGAVTLVQLCKSLYEEQPNEKDLMTAIFEREGKREKNLEQAKKQMGNTKPKQAKDASVEEAKREEKSRSELMKLEEEFFRMVGADEDDDDPAKARPGESKPVTPKKEEPKKPKTPIREPTPPPKSSHHSEEAPEESEHDKSEKEPREASEKPDEGEDQQDDHRSATPASNAQKSQKSEKGDATPKSEKSHHSNKPDEEDADKSIDKSQHSAKPSEPKASEKGDATPKSEKSHKSEASKASAKPE